MWRSQLPTGFIYEKCYLRKNLKKSYVDPRYAEVKLYYRFFVIFHFQSTWLISHERTVELKTLRSKKHLHCVKSVRIRSYSGPHFPTFGLNMDSTPYLSVFSPSAGK